jgi:WD40 repeat protein
MGLLLVLGSVLGAPARAQTGEPIPHAAGADAMVPILQLETGMHTGGIDAMSVDGTGRLLLTASAADKTARLWSLSDGHLLTILRPPQNFGLEGSLDAAALSPNGAVAAVGGDTGADWDGSYFIYIFDTRTGRMTGRLPTGANRPSELVFSPDGRFLVAGLFKGGGIRAWRTDSWTKAGEDVNYGSTVRNISFDHSGRFVTSGDEDVVRLYDSSFHLITSTKIGAVNLHSSISPDGTQVAVTPGLDGELVDILSGHDLRQLFAPDTRGRKVVSNDIIRAMEAAHNGASPGVDAQYDSTTWSSDGRTLYAVGATFGDKQERFVSSWSGGARDARRDQQTPLSIYLLTPLPGGGFVFAGNPTSWGTLGTKSDITQEGSVTDFEVGNIGFHLSTDGRVVTFGFKQEGRGFAEMSLTERKLRSVSQPPADINDSKEKFGPLASHRGLNHLEEGGAGLMLYDAGARKILWQHRVNSSIEDLLLSSDGRLAVVAYSDGTIRWYRASDGHELLAFFPNKDGKRWVLWTPSGYYDASPGGEDLIGWTVNRGKDQAADFFPASRFHDRLYRPDVIDQVLATLDEGKAVKLANAAADRNDARITPELIATLAPPVLELVDAPTRFATDRVTIKYRVRNPADAQTIDSPRIMVNGEWQPTSRAVYQRAADGTRDVVIGPLPPHDSTVKIYADNGNARSEPLTIALQWDARAELAPGQQGLAAKHKPRLFVLAVGISQYQRPDLRLNFAARDAEQFVAAMQAQRGKLYAEVTTKLLRDDEATLAGVKAGLAWFAGQAAADDVGVLFLAGHGVQTPDQDYFYAPADFDPARQRATGVDYRAIRGALDKFSTSGNKVLFFVDTCYPGGALGSNLAASNGPAFAAVLSRSDSGIVVLSASKGDQLSYEGPQWQDGAFTKALLEGIVDGKADSAQSGEITILELEIYVHKRVLVLTEKRQEPMLSMPGGGLADFTVAAH